MKDYCETDYQRKSFITRYIINVDTNELELIYADNEVTTIPYTIKNEIRTLNRMKKQIEYYQKYQDKLLSDKKALRLRKGILLFGASLGAVALAYILEAMYLLGYASAFLLPTLSMDVLMITSIKKRFDLIDDRIIEINDDLEDYKKNMFYLTNEKVFSNERLFRSDVIDKVPDKVYAAIEEREVYNLSNEVPSININNLENFTMKELTKTYNASLQSHGPELVLKPIKRKK